MTAAAAPGAESLVIGLGSPDQGDDAVGLLVARAVEALCLPGVRVETHEDPTALIHLWAGVQTAIVIDAVASGRPPGVLLVRDVGATQPPLPDSSWAATGRGGTHAFGLATAVELARTLGRLPERVVIVGIEAATFEQGAPLSAPVAEAIGVAVDAIARMLPVPVGGVV